MKKYNGSMMAYLNERTQGATENIEGSGESNIQMVDFHQLIPNEKNFYGIREIEQLAHSMALSGTVAPLLVVKRGDGKYNIISGERRFRAVSLRYERGELTSPDVPCMVHEPFSSDGKLTAEMREDIAIVCANSYRQKTALEKLEEVNVLEPIARIYYTDAIKDGSYSGAFRSYFADHFLGMSSTSLQRIWVLRKLGEPAREALQNGIISDTLASVLANRSLEDQQIYLEKLASGEAQGTIRELTESTKQDEEDAPTSEPEHPNAEISSFMPDQVEGHKDVPKANTTQGLDLIPDEGLKPDASENVGTEAVKPTETAGPSEAELEQQGQEKLFDTPIPTNLTPEDAEDEANRWLEHCLKNVAEMAAEGAETARHKGDNRLAAQWEVRKAAVNLVIETIK